MQTIPYSSTKGATLNTTNPPSPTQDKLPIELSNIKQCRRTHPEIFDL